MDDQIIGLTAKIVSDHVANNGVAIDQLPALIRAVHQALATVGQAPAEGATVKPAVDAKKSVFADHLLCLNCGGSFKMLRRHIAADHHMTPEAYRTTWGLPPSYPMVASTYAAVRSKLAKANGLGRKAEPAAPPKKRGRPRKA